MDRDIGIPLKAESHLAVADVEYVTLSRGSPLPEPPTITDSWLFLVKTNMVEPPVL
jgi:hypothetical protein